MRFRIRIPWWLVPRRIRDRDEQRAQLTGCAYTTVTKEAFGSEWGISLETQLPKEDAERER